MDTLRVMVERRENKAESALRASIEEIRDGSKTANYFQRCIEFIDLSQARKVLFVDRYIKALICLEKKKFRMRKASSVGNVVVQIGSLVIPALLSVQHLEKEKSGVVFWTTWAISLATGISANLLSLFKVAKKKTVYTRVYDRLLSEGFKYLELSDHYNTAEPVGAHQRLFPDFFARVESMLLNETRVNGAKKKEIKGEIRDQALDELERRDNDSKV